MALENRGAGSWLVHKHEGTLRDVFKDRREDLVYLSPDATETLNELTPGKVYIENEYTYIYIWIYVYMHIHT